LYISGKYTVSGSGSVIVRGFSGGKPYEQIVPIQLPENNTENKVLPAIWARAKVDEITGSLNFDDVSESSRKEYIEQIENIALKYKLLTNYTSFVAVDESGKTVAPSKRTSAVGVEVPDGMNMKRVFNRRILVGSNVGSMVVPIMDLNTPAPTSMQPIPPASSISSAQTPTGSVQTGSGADTLPPNYKKAKSYSEIKMHATNLNSANLTRNRNYMAMQFANGDYVVSSLGLPDSSKISRDVLKYDLKLDYALKKLLRMPERQKKLCAINVSYTGDRTELLDKLRKLKFKVVTTESETNDAQSKPNTSSAPGSVLTLLEVPFERIHELLPLEQVEFVSIQSVN
jgi:hypothetical protein